MLNKTKAEMGIYQEKPTIVSSLILR